MSRTLVVATTNHHKLKEIRTLLANAPVSVVGLDAFSPIPEPEEMGRTFEANARLKATYYGAATGMFTVAEDSGLEVDALGREPGIYSARYLRPDASYAERFAEIFRRLAEHPESSRTARFVCAVAVAAEGHVVFEARGVVEGEIAPEPRGTAGFGYDPIFFYPPYASTLGEVDEAKKLAVAHRGHAFRALADWLRSV